MELLVGFICDISAIQKNHFTHKVLFLLLQDFALFRNFKWHNSSKFATDVALFDEQINIQ